MDATHLTQLINTLLDTIWPILPAHFLDQLTYV